MRSCSDAVIDPKSRAHKLFANSLHEMYLQGIMVVAFIKTNIQSKRAGECNYHDSLQAHLMKGNRPIALIAVISGLTCKRGKRVNSALY